MTSLQQVQSQLSQLLNELEQQIQFQPKQLFVIGCSTSEIAGSRIGTSGAIEIAEVLFDGFTKFAQKHGLYLVFQGCEHINRALTMEAEAAQLYSLEPVTVVPAKHAGGSMSAYAFTKFENAVVVEHVRAHSGIDIGQTMIGMHLKEVAIPIRTSIRQIGEAIVTIANTRPKLIGGERAVYIR